MPIDYTNQKINRPLWWRQIRSKTTRIVVFYFLDKKEVDLRFFGNEGHLLTIENLDREEFISWFRRLKKHPLLVTSFNGVIL